MTDTVDSTEQKHTPGEWKCGSDEPFVYSLNTAGTNRFFASVQPGWISMDNKNRPGDERTPIDELQANARLIAAAPELLEALKGVVRVADRATVEFDAARAAIAKATK